VVQWLALEIHLLNPISFKVTRLQIHGWI